MEIVKPGKKAEEIVGGFRLMDLLDEEIQCPYCDCVFKLTKFSELENVTFVPNTEVSCEECIASLLCVNHECRRAIFVDLRDERK